MKTNLVSWFEIPTTDIERATKFYKNILAVEMSVVDFGGVKMAWFPSAGEAYGATGSLMQHESYTPSHHGSLVYLSCDDLQKELDRVIPAGGKVLQNKTQISPEHGFMALFEDTEGNRVALHSSK